jgi:predicted Zn-dependent protease
MMSGLVLHDLSQYERTLRQSVSRAFALNGGFGVLGVVPASVADQAGLRSHDEIVAIGGASVDDPLVGGGERQSYKRMDGFSKRLSQALTRGSTVLTVRRNGRLFQVNLTGRLGCGGHVALTPSASLNAWADGTYVNLSTAIMNFAGSDDELAFVVAHEMAHNMLGHVEQLKSVPSGLFGMFGIGSGRVRRTEIEADAFAVTLMNNGGYRPGSAISFLRRANKRLWWAVSLDHPGWSRRMATVTQAMTDLPQGTAMAAAGLRRVAAPMRDNAAPVQTAAALSINYPTGTPARRRWK